MAVMTLTEALTAIRSRLEKATPAPWNIERVDHEHEITFEIGTDAGFFAKIYEHDFIENGRNAKPTCELIAHAPEDIRRLLACLEKAIEQRDSYAHAWCDERGFDVDLSSEDAQLAAIMNGGADEA